MYQWRKGMASWEVGNTVYLSVVFTWHIAEALRVQEQSKKKVVIGGPAAKLLGINADPLPYPVLPFHNPLATFTTRGCPNKCPFCAVPKIEGDLVELPTWEVKPMICDNNITAASKKHFDKVIDSLKPLPWVDFQGVDPGHFTDHHASRFSELKHPVIRFGFDHILCEHRVVSAIERAKKHGIKDIRVYVLFGCDDTPEDAQYRMELIKSLGAMPNPMRYQPLNARHKDEYIDQNWTKDQLKSTMRYWSRQNWLEHIPYDEYKHNIEQDRLIV